MRRRQAAADLLDLYATQAFEDAATFLWAESLDRRIRERGNSAAPEQVATAVRLGLAEQRSVLSRRLLCLEHDARAIRAALTGRRTRHEHSSLRTRGAALRLGVRALDA